MNQFRIIPSDVCLGCGADLDLESCGCGDAMSNHGGYDGYSAVPLGCNCLRHTPVLSPPRRAFEFAKRVHSGQKYGPHDYIFHLGQTSVETEEALQVLGISWEDGFEVRAAAWLHDSVEDAGVTLDTIRAEFGDEVARIVNGVTDEPGPNRKTRKALTLPKTRAAGWKAVLVKLCDRIANACESQRTQDAGKIKMYRKEQADLRAALYSADDNLDFLWADLEDILAHDSV